MRRGFSCPNAEPARTATKTTMSLLRLNCILDYVVAGYHKEFIPIVEDHPERHTLQAKHRQKSSVGVKNLNAAHVTNVHAAISIDSDRIRSAELPRLIASAAKASQKLSVTRELEDRVIESAQCVDVTRPINRDAHTQL